MISGKKDSGFYTAIYTKQIIYSLFCVFVLEDIEMIAHVSRRKTECKHERAP
jgi:hypothetical protein